jgi:hypothetical protein
MMQIEEKSKFVILSPLKIRHSFLAPQLKMDPNATSTPVSVINVTHIICEQCFDTSLSVINVNNLNSTLTLIHA